MSFKRKLMSEDILGWYEREYVDLKDAYRLQVTNGKNSVKELRETLSELVDIVRRFCVWLLGEEVLICMLRS